MARERIDSNLHEDPNNGRGKDGPPISERFLVEQWRRAPAIVDPPYDKPPYPPDRVELPEGVSYGYREGRRLIIVPGGERVLDNEGHPILDKEGRITVKGGNRKLVMDTCEYPWADKTVNLAFDTMVHTYREEPVRVLELGFGLGITANRVIEQLEGRRLKGVYIGVELNEDVYNLALAWKKRKKDEFKAKEKEMPGSKPDIDIEIKLGDAGFIAREILAELSDNAPKKFDIIISDTFPLRPQDAGINDLKHLQVLKKLLAPGGVFTFYPYTPGMQAPKKEGLEGIVTGKQLSLINSHFVTPLPGRRAEVFPPRGYKYLWRGGRPVRFLPVIVCKDPILSKAA